MPPDHRHPQTKPPLLIRTGGISKMWPGNSAPPMCKGKEQVLLFGWIGKDECLNTHDSGSWMLETKTNIFLEHHVFFWGTVTTATFTHVLRKNVPWDKKILNKILLIFRKRALSKFVTWLCLWQVCGGNDFFAAGTQCSACFTNYLYPISQASAKGKASPCQVFWKINKSTAIILTASTDKCNKRQDTKPRFPNGIAFLFFSFLVFDKFYRVALLRCGQVL